MISIRDSLLLSVLKLKAYKTRSLLTITTLSIGAIAILSILFALSGITNIGQQVFKDNLAGKHYISVQILPQCDKNETNCIYSFNQKEFESKYAKYTLGKTDPQYSSDKQIRLDGAIPTPPSANDARSPDYYSYSIQTVPDVMINDVLFPGEVFSAESEVIPIIVPEQAINKDFNTMQQYSSKQRFEKYKSLIQEFKDKEFNLSVASDPSINGDSGRYEKTDIKVKIVGIMFQSNALVPGTVSESFYIPQNALTKQNDIATSLNMTEPRAYHIEMRSKSDRDALVNSFTTEIPSEYLIEPLRSSYEKFADIIYVGQSIAMIFGGFLLTISALFIFTTINKIAGDGRKEIAIFRSYGATRKDIVVILNSYVLIIVAMGFVVGMVVSIILTITGSLLWGDTTFYFLVNSGNYFDIVKPSFMFLDLPWIYILSFLLILCLVGMLAALGPILRASKIQPILALRDE